MRHQEAVKADASKYQPACGPKPVPKPAKSIDPFRDLQQQFGNRAVGRHIQAQLNISQPDDPSEEEADRIADHVMQPSKSAGSLATSIRVTAPIQRKCDECETKEEELSGRTLPSRIKSTIQRKSAARNSVGKRLAGEISATQDAGTRIDKTTKSFMENRFGADFSGVRIHTGNYAAQMAKELDAHAFTFGDHVYFNSGKFAPDTAAGKRLLAHELVHTIQQTNQFQPKAIQREWALQTPAEATATRVLTPVELARAITFNRSKLGTNNALIMELRDVLGISFAAPDIDQEFVEAIQRWQAAHNLTQDGMLGPDTVAPLLRELRAEGLNAEATLLANLVRRGRVRTGPTYTPNGAVAPVAGGVGRQVDFTMTAEFEHDPANGVFASCCEVRQQISWDAAMAASFTATLGNPVPHNGFAATHPHDTLIEDRGPGDAVRFGHRTGPFAGVGVPAPFANNFVNAAGAVDLANGTRFAGRDLPSMFNTHHGTMRFRLFVVDVCNGGVRISGFDNITIAW